MLSLLLAETLGVFYTQRKDPPTPIDKVNLVQLVAVHQAALAVDMAAPHTLLAHQPRVAAKANPNQKDLVAIV